MPDNPYDASIDRRKKKAIKGLQDLEDLRNHKNKTKGLSPRTKAQALQMKKAAKLAGARGYKTTQGITTTVAPSMSTNVNAKVTITSPLALNPGDKDSVVMEAHDDSAPFIEVFKTPEAIPKEGQIGALVFAKGIAYIRTPAGIVNLGYALGHADPIFITSEQKMDKKNDRRAAIKAQKAKKKGNE